MKTYKFKCPECKKIEDVIQRNPPLRERCTACARTRRLGQQKIKYRRRKDEEKTNKCKKA